APSKASRRSSTAASWPARSPSCCTRTATRDRAGGSEVAVIAIGRQAAEMPGELAGDVAEERQREARACLEQRVQLGEGNAQRPRRLAGNRRHLAATALEERHLAEH